MLYDLLKSRRSIRRFQDKPVEQEKKDLLLKSALLSPSSRSRRPWEFVVVTDKEFLNKLSQCREHSSQFLAGAPLGIVIIADPETSDVWIEDSAIAAVIIQLSAQSCGLSSCWIQVRERFHADGRSAGDYIKAVLGIPDKYRVECIIAVGYAAEEKEPYRDDSLPTQKIHSNRF